MHPLGQLGLEFGGLRAVDPVLLAGQVAIVHQLVDVRLGQGGRAKQLVDGRQQQLERHAGAAAALGLRQGVEDCGARALGAGFSRAEAARDAVRGQESHSEHAGQLVGPLGHEAVGAVAVGLADPGGEIGQAVRGEQHVQPAGDPQPLPRAGRLGQGGAADPGRGEGFVRIAVDGVERAGRPVAVDQADGPLGADVLDPDQVGDHRVGVGIRGREGVRLGDLDLAAVSAVVDPLADHEGALALLEVNEGTDEDDRVGAIRHRLDDSPAGLGARVAGAADRHL